MLKNGDSKLMSDCYQSDWEEGAGDTVGAEYYTKSRSLKEN